EVQSKPRRRPHTHGHSGGHLGRLDIVDTAVFHPLKDNGLLIEPKVSSRACGRSRRTTGGHRCVRKRWTASESPRAGSLALPPPPPDDDAHGRPWRPLLLVGDLLLAGALRPVSVQRPAGRAARRH